MDEDLCPKFRLTTLHEVASLLFKHRVFIGDRDKLVITEALCVGNVRQVGIPSLTEFSNNERLIQLQ